MIDPRLPRPITHRYVDPVDVVWLTTARRLGLQVRRSPQVYAATDGHGLLEIGDRDTLDPDDCTAQMIFHELCHWIANGLETFFERDWGFPLEDLDDWRELSGLRLQAWLAERYGLGRTLASTAGGFRQYYDQILDAPLSPLDDSEEERLVVEQALLAVERAQGEPWQVHLDRALTATRTIRGALEPFLADYVTDVPHDALPSLWAMDPPPTA